MAQQNNPFYVEPANPLQALMVGVQGFEGARKRASEDEMKAGRLEAMQALQSGGDIKSPLAKLIGIGDTKGAEAIATFAKNQADQSFRQQSLAQTGAHQNALLAQQGTFQGAQIANMEAQRRLQEKQLDATLEGTKVPPGFTRGPNGGLIPIPGGPTDPAYIQAIDSSKNKAIPQQVEERRRAAISEGLDTKDPNVRSYILTGKLSENQPLTATDKKAILEADEGVLAAETAIKGLQQAKELSKKAYAGPMAGTRGYAAGLVGSDAGQSTTELDNLLTGNALSQLKLIFGGMPTEGERKILLDIQGSVSQPDSVRQKIYDRAIVAANARLAFNRQRAQEMRGGTFYKKQGENLNLTGPDKKITGVSTQDIPPPPPGFVVVK